jgi:hypothetical protein
MNKSSALVLLLILAAACGPSPTNREAAPTNSTVIAPPASAALTEADAIAKEKAIWETIKNKDYDTYAGTLADDQIEIAADGVYDKAASIAAVKNIEPAEITFDDWKYLPIDKDAIVLSYTVTIKGKYKGKEFPSESTRASSAWVKRGGKWLAMYHQECPVSKLPPPPASRTPPATTSPTPTSASTPLPPGSDPIATERALWETLKNKDYNGFGSFLADDSIQVEPGGVHDKAGSIKGVGEFDLSKAQLSDFKSVPFDADAAVVTYVLKLPGSAPAERHSTIWAKRDNRWLAVFHHATPIPRGTPSTPPTPAATATPSP